MKGDGSNELELPICYFLLVFNNTYNLTRLLYNIQALNNPSDLDFNIWRSLKIKSGGVAEHPRYDFLLMLNSNIWPTSAPTDI